MIILKINSHLPRKCVRLPSIYQTFTTKTWWFGDAHLAPLFHLLFTSTDWEMGQAAHITLKACSSRPVASWAKRIHMYVEGAPPYQFSYFKYCTPNRCALFVPFDASTMPSGPLSAFWPRFSEMFRYRCLRNKRGLQKRSDTPTPFPLHNVEMYTSNGRVQSAVK